MRMNNRNRQEQRGIEKIKLRRNQKENSLGISLKEKNTKWLKIMR